MKWFNLKNNKCPKCNQTLMQNVDFKDGLIVHDCGFTIRENRMQEIVADMNGQKVQKDWWEEENV